MRLLFGKDELPRAMNCRARPENSMEGTKASSSLLWRVWFASVSLILSVAPIFGRRKSGDFSKCSRE